MTFGSHNEPWVDVVVHDTSRDFLTATWPSICKRESAANTILPYALEMLSLEKDVVSDNDVQPLPTGASNRFRNNQIGFSGQIWLTCWSLRKGPNPVLDLVLSCTDGFLGSRPIFLYSNIPHSQITQTFLDPRMVMLIKSLLNIVPITRVFSVFGPSSLASNFSKQWSYITGQVPEAEPLYSATFSYATRETLTTSSSLPSHDFMREANLNDVHTVGQLFKEFADSSVHYPLSYEQGVQEAMELILKRRVWVYQRCDGELPSVVAVARTSPNVAAITKVYTTHAWRNQGYAERLVRRVTHEMLYNAGKKRVVLYVGHGNPAAKVYHRVGFTGLKPNHGQKNRDDWAEIGFQEAHRGHW